MRSRDPLDLLPPRILVVDDERQIHAALRLRIGFGNDLVFCSDARSAVQRVSEERFDLCLVDIHMPEMDGFGFIDAARKADPQLGYVVLSAFDSDENLRRTIPLQVYDFISKPLPSKQAFEGRIQGWVDATRTRRREHALAQQADTLACERDSARMERDVELVASESARDALLQTASLLTTISAHYLSACSVLAPKSRSDSSLITLLRAMEQGRRATDAVMNIVDRFLGSAYGSRDTSPAMVNDGIRDAIILARRDSAVQQLNKFVHFTPIDLQLPLRGLSGISFLLLVLPSLAAALSLSAPNTTVGVSGERWPRLDMLLTSPRTRSHLWLNRRNSLISHAGWVITITASAPALTRASAEEWLKGEFAPLATITARGVIEGVQKAHGLLGFAVAPESQDFRLFLALPA
jgi:CheY-like chemotaxis protein